MSTLQQFSRFVVIPFILAAAPALGGCSAPGGLAKGASSAELHTVTVVGHGEVHAKPDVARANLGVEVTAPTVEEATKLSSARMTALLEALKKVGIAEITNEFVELNSAERAEPDAKNVAVYRELQALQDEASGALRVVFKRHRKFVLGEK